MMNETGISTTVMEKAMKDQREKEIEDKAEASKELYVGALGSGSDFTVFLQHLGICSGNVGFSRKKTDPVYH